MTSPRTLAFMFQWFISFLLAQLSGQSVVRTSLNNPNPHRTVRPLSHSPNYIPYWWKCTFCPGLPLFSDFLMTVCIVEPNAKRPAISTRECFQRQFQLSKVYVSRVLTAKSSKHVFYVCSPSHVDPCTYTRHLHLVNSSCSRRARVRWCSRYTVSLALVFVLFSFQGPHARSLGNLFSATCIALFSLNVTATRYVHSIYLACLTDMWLGLCYHGSLDLYNLAQRFRFNTSCFCTVCCFVEGCCINVCLLCYGCLFWSPRFIQCFVVSCCYFVTCLWTILIASFVPHVFVMIDVLLFVVVHISFGFRLQCRVELNS